MTRATAMCGPADDEAFVRSRFRSAPLAGVLGDVQHCLDTRGRTVCATRYLQAMFPGAAPSPAKTVMIEVGPFTALPGEDEYHVQLLLAPTITFPEDLHRVRAVYWQVETEDTAGANTSTGPWQSAGISIPPRRRGSGLALLGWPNSQGAAHSEVAVPLTIHRVDPALARAGRVLRVYGYSVSGVSALDPDYFWCSLRGIFATGHRRD